jgi:CNT family concentrative nucleoside transporter
MSLAYSVLRGVGAIVFILLMAFLLSNNKKRINWKIPVFGLLTNIILINFILHTSFGQVAFEYAGKAVDRFIHFSFAGTQFVFGSLYTGNEYAFIFMALIPLVFFGAFMSLLYHYGVVQWIIKVVSIFLIKVLKLSGVESMGICGNVLVGQSEGAVVIGPYIPKLTDSELFMIMTSGMASVAGSLLYAYASMGANLTYVIAASIVSAPSAVIIAKMIFPEVSSEDKLVAQETRKLTIHTHNAIDALGHGAANGAKVAIAVGVMLLAFIAFISLLNSLVGVVSFHHLSFDSLLGYVFMPIAYIIGVPSADVHSFAVLFGQKTCFNEFVAYTNLKNFTFTPKGFSMMCFALTGFANFSSIAIQIGCYGAQHEPIKPKMAQFGLKALTAAVLANLLSAALAGMFFI